MQTNKTLIETKIQELVSKLQQHSFLQRCREGTITKSELEYFLIQHGHYGSYFTRYLCAMMANLQNNDQVLALSENLFEELGLEPDSPKPHHLIYREMLQHFSLDLETNSSNPATRNLINTMLEHCRKTDPAYGLGALCIGAEGIVPQFYTSVIEGFRSQGVEDQEIEFFLIHVECDDGHAETLNQIMMSLADSDKASLQTMFQAGEAMIDARMTFLSAIEQHADAKQSAA
jgi:pyrroloquinoline-quinone synthase